MLRTRRITTAVTAAALALPAAASAQPGTAPDCRFEGARDYESFGELRTFTTDGRLFGCHTDVGRAYRLDTGTVRARTAATRRAVFGAGAWIGHPSRERSGATRVRAIDVRTGRSHATRTARVASALVVNWNGTLAWIAGRELWTKPIGRPARRLAADSAIDTRFLGIENDRGCAVTWRSGGEQRSSSIYCSHP